MTIGSGIKASRRRVAWVQLNPFLRQLFESAANYFRRGGGSLSRESVKAFFDRHRGDQPDPLVFDGSRSGYYDQLLQVMPQQSAVRYIDLGCGTGGLCAFLRARSISFETYIGVDFSPIVGELFHGDDAIIRNASLDGEDLLEYLVPATHVVMINSICYQDTILEIPILRAASRCKDAALLVVEPYPGLFWDTQFEGIRPRYRYPDQLMREASTLGWIPSRLVIFYLIKIGPLFLWPLAYSLSFKSVQV